MSEDRTHWHDRWDEGRVGFHRAEVNAHLRRFIDARPARGSSVPTEESPRALVPLCGKSLDLWFLRDEGFAVTGVELVPRAVQDLFADAGHSITWAEGGAVARGGGIEVRLGDFLQVPVGASQFDLIWDRAALVAISPSSRTAYRDRLLELLAPGGVLVLVSVEYPEGALGGPPHRLPDREVQALFAPHGLLRCLDETTATVGSARTPAVERLYRFSRAAP